MSSRRKPPGPARRAPGDDGVWLYGRHAVAAALANPARVVRRLLATTDAAGGVRPERAVEVVDRTVIEQAVGPHAPHQGVAALCAPLPDHPLDDAFAAMAPGRPILLLDQVTDPQNVGAILRSACAFDACAVIMQDRHAPPETGALAKAASGALDLVPIVRATNLARAIDAAKAAGAWALGLTGDAALTLMQGAPADRPVLLALGAEGPGLRRLTRERCDALVRLPISERMESLNVSAAAAVALSHLPGR